MFATYGWHDAPVYGKTPTLERRKMSGLYEGVPRGKEINAWLSGQELPYNYVILDDNSDMLPDQKNNFINTSPFVGLTSHDAEEAIRILNDEQNKIQ
jgi:hypothetical protein